MKKSYWGKSFRIVLMACLLLMAMMQAVSAEKVEYKDKNYNFKAIINVLLYDMDFSDKQNIQAMFYRPVMDNGVIIVPPINSPKILR